MQCTAKTARGRQCAAFALVGETKCLLHSGRAVELGRRGGCRRGRLEGLKGIPRPRTAAQVRNLVSQYVVELRRGDLDSRLGNTLVDAAGLLLKAISVSNHEARIRKLEQDKEALGGRKSRATLG